jgi:hypothetical protein
LDTDGRERWQDTGLSFRGNWEKHLPRESAPGDKSNNWTRCEETKTRTGAVGAETGELIINASTTKPLGALPDQTQLSLARDPASRRVTLKM